MSLLLDWFVQPLGLIFTALLLGQLGLLRASVPLLARLALLLGTLGLWVSAAPVTANALVRKLETPLILPAADACASLYPQGTVAAPVVILGAGLDAYVASDNPYEVLTRESLLRTLGALAYDYNDNRFYLLGGGQTSRKLSDFMAQVLIDRGIDESRIIRDTNSRSTRDNARQLTLLVPADAVPAILVTSHLHMNRAIAVFRAEGFQVCPAAVDSLYSVSAGWVGYLPSIDSLVKSTHAWRELLATLWYRWRGAGVR